MKVVQLMTDVVFPGIIHYTTLLLKQSRMTHAAGFGLIDRQSRRTKPKGVEVISWGGRSHPRRKPVASDSNDFTKDI